MAINPHHTVEEINGVRCSIVEKAISPERSSFLKNILEYNGLEVHTAIDAEGKITLGVTNILFNAVHSIYGRILIATDGRVVTPSYWYNQKHNKGFYWEYKRES